MKVIANGFIIPNILTPYFETEVPEASLIEWVNYELKDKEGIFIDIGAHVGTWSINLANSFLHTHAFEPQKDIYNCLCGNIALAELSSKITAYNTAICSIYGKRLMQKTTEGGGEASLIIQGPIKEVVETNVLDTYRLNNVKLIKIDVEGNELNVLKSARLTLLNNNNPPLLIECWRDERGQDRDALFEYIKKIGYKITPINNYPEMFLAKT